MSEIEVALLSLLACLIISGGVMRWNMRRHDGGKEPHPVARTDRGLIDRAHRVGAKANGRQQQLERHKDILGRDTRTLAEVMQAIERRGDQ